MDVYFLSLVVYLLVVLLIGISLRSKVTTFTDFAIAGRSLPFILLIFTFFSTYLGPGSTIGWVAEARRSGLWVFPSMLSLWLLLQHLGTEDFQKHIMQRHLEI